MKLQEIFDQLSSGELSQTNLGEITEDKWPRVVMHLNLGLSDLFKRFFLREGRLKMQLRSGQVDYPIEASYAVANSKSKVEVGQRFILDSTGKPFANDVLKVESVLTDAGYELGLDDASSRWTLRTTDTFPPTLRVPSDIVEKSMDLPEALKTSTLDVVYRARHPNVNIFSPGFNPSRYEVRLPYTHLQALCYYVASRVLGPAGMGQTEGMSSAGYWKRYEAECAQLTDAGTQLDRNSSDSDGDKLRSRGFV